MSALVEARRGRPARENVIQAVEIPVEQGAQFLRFFAERDNFGLEHVRFFVQGQMPGLDRETGRVLLANQGRLALSPDGHGGTFSALAAPGPGGAPSCRSTPVPPA